MELAIYFSNVKMLFAIDDALRNVNLNDIPRILLSALFSHNPNVYEYSVNVAANTWIETLRNRGTDFSRLYFGQEFCQNLIPTPEELEQAFYFSRQMEWNFSYVTGGYNTEVGIQAIENNLRKLSQLDPEAEIIVNDWGVLHVLTKSFPHFKLVLGRMLNKQVRLNLFAKGESIPIYAGGIETPIEQIRENQLKAYADVSVSNPDYLQTLKDWGIQGVDFDMTPQGISRPEDGWGLTMGLYYPWAFIATARNCPTAGTVDPLRTYILTDKPCGRPCRKINCSPKMLQYENSIVQRGPALFIQDDQFNETYVDTDRHAYERLIYEPMIPL